MKRRATWPFVLAGLTLAALLLFAVQEYRQQQAPDQSLLPVAFEHLDHNATACAECHHNFVDHTGGGTCYTCHKYVPEIAPGIENMFHQFCFSCHVEKRTEGEASGPMRECQGCHHR